MGGQAWDACLSVRTGKEGQGQGRPVRGFDVVATEGGTACGHIHTQTHIVRNWLIVSAEGGCQGRLPH